jgi:hypothetical protein
MQNNDSIKLLSRKKTGKMLKIDKKMKKKATCASILRMFLLYLQ